jgi:superoxide dismutase
VTYVGGGHLNHSIFWQNLAPVSKGGGNLSDAELLKAINAQYGSLENLQNAVTAATVAVQGSGWGWLGYDKVNHRLAVTTTANQDPLQATTGLVPLFGIDVWEHAYYLQVSLVVRLEYTSYSVMHLLYRRRIAHSTRMFALTTSRTSGRSSTGPTSPNASTTPRSKYYHVASYI